ncbi:hypothetical protein [Veronia nyctiphanis]|uniref:hypothetical protein n=1 Tax=Veronia nyctiphanis TaxID=1278244 RepID=UPI0038B55FD5
MRKPENDTGNGFQADENSRVKLAKVRGFKLLADVTKGVKFQDSISETEENQQGIALESVNQI